MRGKEKEGEGERIKRKWEMGSRECAGLLQIENGEGKKSWGIMEENREGRGEMVKG